MFRSVVLAGAVVVWGVSAAVGQTSLERGRYLVSSILACGNCHTPKDPSGAPIAEKELAGGSSFITPAFDATASNITPDAETGIGKWTDEEIKRSITEGMRPNHGRLAGVPTAAVMAVNFFRALLPRDLDAVVTYLRAVKPVSNAVPDPVYKAPVHHDKYPDAEAGFTEEAIRDPVKRGAYLVTIGHCMECHSTRERGVFGLCQRVGEGWQAIWPCRGSGISS